jgi:hypothetical protein
MSNVICNSKFIRQLRIMLVAVLGMVAAASYASAALEFPQVRNAQPNTAVVSSSIKLDDLSSLMSISIEGGEYSINNQPFTTKSLRIINGDTLRVKVQTSKEEKGEVVALVHLGKETIPFSVVNAGRPIGINFNEQMGVLTDAVVDINIAQLQPTWARGFLDFYSLFDKNTLEPLPEFADSANIARFIELKKKGYKTVLSIKWNYKAKHTPKAMPSSPESLRKHQDALQSLYDKVWPYVDILVVGNEPFIESPSDKVPSRDQHLVAFYSAMLDATIDYRAHSNRKETPLFLGAFNRLETERFQKASLGLLELAKSTPEVAGIDLHIHHADSDFSAMKTSIDFATARIRPDQRFISTEFSAMHYWKSKTPLALSPAFTAKYHLPEDMKVHQYLNKALATQPKPGAVPHDQWLDFVEMNSWYRDLQSRYLADAYRTFTDSPQFLLATYSFRQGFNGTFDTTRDPWILNAIFVNRTVPLRPDGSYELNKYYHRDFDRLR